MDCPCSRLLAREQIPLSGSKWWREVAMRYVPWWIFVEDSLALSEALPCSTARKSHYKFETCGRVGKLKLGLAWDGTRGDGGSRQQRGGGILFWKRECNNLARVLVWDSPYSIFDQGKENRKIILCTNGHLFYIPRLPLPLQWSFTFRCAFTLFFKSVYFVRRLK